MVEYGQLHPYTVIGFLTLGLIIAFANHLFVRRPGNPGPSVASPFVSILVPARNEAENINACIASLLAQDYPYFEVIVLDDASEDATRRILERLRTGSEKLRIIDGLPLPPGWLGKHWACHQLSGAARGEFFLFTDADTRHHPEMLPRAVAALLAKKADFLTAFPKEELGSWGERLTVPILGFALFSFIPFPLGYWLKIPAFSVTLGQLMLFRKSAFEAIGGYNAIRAEPVDDVTLGRRIIQHGYKWLLVDGTRLLSCRMYSGFQSALDGFTKNLFDFFGRHTLLYLVAWIWIGIAFVEPAVILILNLLGHSTGKFSPLLAGIAVAESLLLFAIAYHRLRFPYYLAFLYPISILLFVFIALRSFMYSAGGKSTWKGRILPRSRLRM